MLKTISLRMIAFTLMICSISAFGQAEKFNARAAMGSITGTISDVEVVDFDGDGDEDVFVASQSSNLVYYIENQGGAFLAPSSVRTLASAHDLELADLDNDDDLDLVAAGNGEIIIIRNDLGLRTYIGNVSATGVDFESISLGDIDGNGSVDLLASNSSNTTVSWWSNTGSGSFSTQTSVTVGRAEEVKLADIDGDNDLDAIIAFSSDITYVTNNGSGFDATANTISASDTLTAMAVGDVDGDNDLDILTGTTETALYVNYNDNLNFTESQLVTSLNNVRDIEIGDVNGDGHQDFVVASTTGDDIWYFENDGSNNWTDALLDGNLGLVETVEIHDFDKDGYMDIVSASSLSGGSEVVWYENNTVNPLQAQYDFTSGSLNDLSGNDLHLTDTVGFVVAADRFGVADNAVTLNGVNQSFTATISGTPQLTLAVWFKTEASVPASSDYFNIMEIAGGAGLGITESNHLSATMQLVPGSFTGINSNSAVNDGLWHFAVATYDGTAMVLYLDGIEIARDESITGQVNYFNDPTNITIGYSQSTTDKWYSGSVDDVRYYNYALSSTEINALYSENNWPAQQVSDMNVVMASGEQIFMFQNMNDRPEIWTRILNIAEGGDSFTLEVLEGSQARTYGDAGDGDQIADLNANGITITDAGYHYIRYNVNSREFLVYKVNTVGLLGSARADGSGWDDPDSDLIQGSNEGIFYAHDIPLLDGEWKLRANDDWGVLNWGDDSANPDGFFELFGDNISVAAGTYDIVANIMSNNYWITPAMGTPVVSVFPLSTSEIQLSWPDVENETGYRIFRTNTYPSDSYDLIAELGENVTSYIDNNLPAGTGYIYYVESFNATNFKSNFVHPTSTFTTNTETLNTHFKLTGGTNNDYGRAITTDADGNYFVLAEIAGSMSDDLNSFTVTNSGLYLARYSPDHILQSSLVIDPYESSVGDGEIFMNDMVYTPDGNLYITGFWRGRTPEGGITYQPSSTELLANMFLMKVDVTSDLSVTYTKLFTSTGFSTGQGLAFDEFSNIYLAGQVTGQLNYAGGSYQDPGAVLLKVHADGSEAWLVHGTASDGTGDSRGYGVAYDETNDWVYFTGQAHTSTNFAFSTIGNSGGNDAFLAKYDANGGFFWVQSIGSDGNDVAWDVVLDKDENPYISGYFSGANITIGATTYTNAYDGLSEMFLVKYDQNANVLWSLVGTSTLREQSIAMASDQNAIYLTGWTDGFVTTFGNATIPAGEVFIASVDPSGSVNWVENIEGEGFANDIHADGGYVYSAGRVTNVVNLAGTVYTTNNGSADSYHALFKVNEFAGSGLVGYYTFTSESVEDVSGFGGPTGSWFGGYNSMDRYGNPSSSLELFNDGAFVELNFSSITEFTVGGFGFGGWIRSNSFPEGEEIWDMIMDCVDFGGLYINQQGNIDFHWYDPVTETFKTASSERSIQRNQYTHVFFTVDENKALRIYIDGVQTNLSLDGSPAFQSSITIETGQPTENIVYIGSPSLNPTDNRWFNGNIDDVRIYSGGIPDANTIYDLYASEVPGGEDRLVASYTWDNGEFVDQAESFNQVFLFDVDYNFLGSSNPNTDIGFDGTPAGAMSFSGMGTFVNVLHERALNLQNNFSVNFWFKPYQLPDNTFGDILLSNGVAGVLMLNPEGKLFYHYHDGAEYPSVLADFPSIEAGKWHMITYSIDDAGNLTVYTDGEVVLSADVSNELPNSDHTIFQIGTNWTGFGGDHYLNGAVDELDVYQRVLSPSEVRQKFVQSDDRLLAYFPLDGDPFDYSGNGNDGNLNGPILTSDRFGNQGNAYFFNGADQDISGTLGNLATGNIDFTMMAWIKPEEDGSPASVFSMGSDVPFGRNSIYYDLGSLRFVGENNDLVVGATVNPNEWSHVAIAKIGAVIDISVNGQFAGSGTLASDQNVTSNLFSIGSTFGGREHFFGAIDEVRVYNQFLDANEIEAIYNSEKPAGGASQVGYFPWSVDANDYSGNAYNGTLLGGASVSGTLMTGFNAEDAVTVPAEMMHGLGDFTVTTYVNFSQLNTGGGFPSNTFLSGANSSTDNALDLFYDKNFNSWRIGLNGVFTDGQFFDDQVFENTWYHVAYSRLGGEVTVYVDGNPRGTVFVNEELLNIETGGLIFGQEQDNVGGGFQADQSMNGQLSTTRIFSSALSQAEVQQLAVQDAPVPPLAASNVQARVFGPTAVNLSWTDNSDNESGFDIQVNVGGSQFAYMEVPANSNVIFISGLETGLQYEFIVIAKNGFGTNVTPESRTYATPIQLITPIVTVEPVAFSLDDAITITAYPDRMYPVGDLVNEDRIYMHSGLVFAGNENQGGWTAAPGDVWGTDSGIGEMTRNPDGSFSITIQDPRSYYGAVDTVDYAQIGLLFRNVEGSRIGLSGYNPTAGTQDIFIDLFNSEDIQKPEGRFATFNGVDYLDLSLNTEAATPTVFTSPTTFTIEGWINLTSLPESAGASLFGRISNSKDVVDLEIYHNGGTSYSLDFGIGEASGAGIINWYTYELSQPEQLVGNWNHVAAVYDNGAISVYLNGDLVREGSASPLVGVGLGTDDLIYAGQGLNGKIDELRFWNQAQSASEIRSKIGVTLSGNDSGLAGHWPMDDLFDDGDGLGAYTPDLTSNGNKLYATGEQVVFNALPDIIGEVTAANGTGIYDGAEFLIGNTNNVEYRITNNVDADTTASGTLTTLFYLSTDFVLDGLDQLIGSDQQTLNNLAQGQSTSFNALVDIPGGINAGNYVLVIAADAYNEIDEVDDNNLFGYNITLIDLQPYVINSVTLQEATAESLTFNWSYNNPSDNSGVSYEWQLISGDFTTIIATGSTNETTATVSGLAYNTTYNFSVKALASGDSRQSLFETIQVMTLNDEEDPIVINISANENTDPAVEQTATIFASDEISGVSRVEIWTKNRSTSDFELKGNAVEVNVNGTTKEYTYTIPAGDIPAGSLAVQIQAIAFDNAGRMSNPVTRNISINQQTITDIVKVENPDIISGGTGITDYTIFAFPFKAKSLRSIITADQVRENWVIEEWTGFTYNDYPSDLEYGKGYWIIVNDASILPINFSGVESAPITGDQGYEIDLNANWTLIGNPSTVGSLNWGTVLQHNVDRGFITSTNSVSQLYVYTGTGSINGYATTNSLRTYQGAFVKNETGSPLTLEIPINAIQGARVEQAIAAPRDYMQPEGGWEIVMDMNAENKVAYGISGFGMHPSAVNGKDNWDMSTPILFNEYLKAEFIEHELEGEAVARSIHAPAFNDVWTTEISTHLPKGTVVRIDFNGNPLLKEGQELVMFDPQTGMTQRVDENASYSFTYEENYKLTFILGDHVFIDEQTQINKVFVNQLYPNPSQGEFMLSVAVPTEFMKYELRVKVTDLAGRTLHQVPFVPGSSGLQHINLDVRALGLQSGLYLFEIEVRDIENAANNYKITKKGYLINR